MVFSGTLGVCIRGGMAHRHPWTTRPAPSVSGVSGRGTAGPIGGRPSSSRSLRLSRWRVRVATATAPTTASTSDRWWCCRQPRRWHPYAHPWWRAQGAVRGSSVLGVGDFPHALGPRDGRSAPCGVYRGHVLVPRGQREGCLLTLAMSRKTTQRLLTPGDELQRHCAPGPREPALPASATHRPLRCGSGPVARTPACTPAGRRSGCGSRRA